MGALRLRTQVDEGAPGVHGVAALRDLSPSLSLRQLVDTQCQDQKMIDAMGPVVESLGTFWEKDHHMTIYPWAITGLAALRYGGVSVVKNDGVVEAFDHDLDFLIQMPNSTRKQVDAMVRQWRSHLQEKTGYKSYDSTPPGTEHLRVKRAAKYNNVEASHYFIFIKKPSRTTKKMSEQGMQFWDDFYGKFMKGGPVSKKDFAKSVKGRTKYTTMVDLWVKHDGRPLDEGYKASEKKMLFLGHEFSSPKNPELLHGDILATYKDTHRIHKTKNLCDLREPNGVIEEDVAPSMEESERVHKCSKILSDHGYFSISEHCQSPLSHP